MTSSTKNDDLTIYCHGLPGSPEELYFQPLNDTTTLKIIGPQHQAEIHQYIDENPNQSLHVIGFSLGAMAAIKIASKHEQSVNRLSLISSAAPLELGDFLPKMAGRFVFETAARGDLAFRMLTALQSVGVNLSSDRIINAIFKGSPEPELALSTEPDFKKALVTGLKKSYGKNNVAYRNEVRNYVQPWAHHLSKITCPVRIHHGVADNWAPIEMAYALQKEITSKVDVIEYEGLGHFSTLEKALLITMQNQ